MFNRLYKRQITEQVGWSRSPHEDLIMYRLPSTGRVILRIYDSSGREIRELVNTIQRAGEHEVCWDGKASEGTLAPSGIYYYRVFSGNSAITGRIIHSNPYR